MRQGFVGRRMGRVTAVAHTSKANVELSCVVRAQPKAGIPSQAAAKQGLACPRIELSPWEPEAHVAHFLRQNICLLTAHFERTPPLASIQTYSAMTLSCWVSLLYFSSYFLVSDEGVRAEGGRGARRQSTKGVL